jgi:hypothetical protein
MRAQMLNPGAALIETEWTSYTTDEKPPPLASRARDRFTAKSRDPIGQQFDVA